MTTTFPCATVEGGLLGADLLDAIFEGSAPGQKPSDFGLEPRRHLSDEIAAAWSFALSYWAAFNRRLERLPEQDAATSATRDQWVIPLLGLMGYELSYTPRAAEIDGQTFAISHRAGSDDGAPPVHIVGCRQPIGTRPESGRPRLAPHVLLQEFLNRTEHLWGLVTNGYTLRLLRDSQLLRRQAYVEFDLRRMMETGSHADFALLYRLAHRSRLPATDRDASDCILERYRNLTIEQGGRIREHLREAVEAALRAFADGFFRHPRNEHLRAKAQQGAVTPLDFYGQLLRLIYRLLFLMVAEERGLIADSQIYNQHYSVTRLRTLAQRHTAYDDHLDLWLGLDTTFRLFQNEALGQELDVPPLNGDLFSADSTSHLNGLFLTNRDLLTGIWRLSMYRENERSPWRRVNYAAIDVEELGSVYESLLDYHPHFALHPAAPALERVSFELIPGTERKTTGSYYTPPDLVNELIKSALEPVLSERLRTASGRAEKEAAILSLAVCDPACGSGHFLLAAARRLGKELARVRTGDDEPSPEETRVATRLAITSCIYGVDKNPLAVDLCKVALWMEGHARGKPLTFLDHRIRCGDSLVGVLTLDVLRQGIPDAAYSPVTGDDRALAADFRDRNHKERQGGALALISPEHECKTLADAQRTLAEIGDETAEAVRRKANAYQETHRAGTRWWQDNMACHLWTAAFFTPLTPATARERQVPTTADVREYLETGAVDRRTLGQALALASAHRFFHWPVEFADVFARGGFDVVLGNPPWERIKLQEQEFFASRDPQIATAPNKAARERLIKRLPQHNPPLWEEFQQAKHRGEAESKFVRQSGRFPLTGRGDINTYAVFAETNRALIGQRGRAGFIVQSDIATGDTYKEFFSSLLQSAQLVSFYDFVNTEGLFPNVHRTHPHFCLVTLSGKPSKEPTDFAFWNTRTAHLGEAGRHFALTAADLALLNPNTETCPIFRSQRDAEITKGIYRRVPVLVNQRRPDGNPWGLEFLRMFDMANDSGLFRTRRQLEQDGWTLQGNVFTRGGVRYLPLYEAKLLHQFDHRWATYEGDDTREMTDAEKRDPAAVVMPRYWVPEEEVEARLAGKWDRAWLLGWRDITNTTNERTVIASVLPRVGVGHTSPIALPARPDLSACLLADLCSFALDYVARQKIGGTHLTYGFLNQLPILPPEAFTGTYPFLRPDLLLDWVRPRLVELICVAEDAEPFAADSGTPTPSFGWDLRRRFLLRCELDAAFFHLYGIARDDVDYIMDTFPIVKRKDEAAYGEYRTKRMILQIYDAMARAMETGVPYETVLDPPPADPRLAHEAREAEPVGG